jgi:Winged helix-turn helix
MTMVASMHCGRSRRGGPAERKYDVGRRDKFLTRYAKAAGAGELLNIRGLKIAYEEEIGHPTSDSTIYNLLARHQWRKLMPRPFHPERDEEAQEAYKKRGFARP